MRIAYIAAGAGGMYCGSCIHDNTLAAALQKQGHEVALLPTYTPLRTDEENVTEPHLFYGALNVFLQHKSGLFRHTPRLIDNLLDRPGLLRWVSRLGAGTDPRGLGGLSLDVLRGEAGHQSKELDKLVAWLRDVYQPDLVQITNSLLLGLVRRIQHELRVPVVVALQGEDLFVDQLREPHRSQVIAELRQRAAGADLFIAPSRYYADHMAEQLALDPARIAVVPLGIQLDGHGTPPQDATIEDTPPEEATDTVTLGFFARICPEKGVHRLVDAFIKLAGEAGGAALRLRVGGYLGPRDQPFWQQQEERLQQAGLGDRFELLGDIDRADKIRFLRSLDLLCAPTTYREAKGLYALEAMANGVPVVLPHHGSFPEMIADTNGGVLFEPDSEEDLLRCLRRLIADPVERRALGSRGETAVHRHRGAQTMAAATAEVYTELLATAREQS